MCGRHHATTPDSAFQIWMSGVLQRNAPLVLRQRGSPSAILFSTPGSGGKRPAVLWKVLLDSDRHDTVEGDVDAP